MIQDNNDFFADGFEELNKMTLENIHLNALKKTAEADDLSILESETYKDAFPGLNEQEIIWSQHQLILNLKKEIFDLKQQMTGHLISVHY